MSVKSLEEKVALHLLGPPRVMWQDASLSILRQQARATLYCIAAEPASVPRERLAFLFWPDEPEARAQRNLSRLLSFLRKELPHPDCLLVNRRTVQLNRDWAWSDCLDLEEAHESRELATLKRSADLYRGRFLEGFSVQGASEFSKWQEQRAAELESTYLGVLNRLIAALSERNQIQAAVDYGKRYLAVDELAEEIHRRLITLYGRAGDRAAAMRQFEQCSLLLERELGVSPLPETREAYESALHDDGRRSSVARSPSWSVLPSLELPLIGREAALTSLEKAATRLASGGLILITGEAGVGKSRLMQTFALGSERATLTGNSHAATHSIAYQPLVEALRQTLHEPRLWRTIRPIWRAEAGRLLPELPEIFPDLPLPLDVPPAEAQGRLVEALARCLFGLATDSPLLLCLDDLHWADEATLHWLAGLSGRFPDPRLLVVATVRRGEEGIVSDVRRAFRRANRITEIALGGLTEEAVRSALGAMELSLPEKELLALAGRLQKETGGNPFFILETVRTLMESNRLHTAVDSLPLAPTVEDAVAARVERLTPISQQLLQAAAVLAPDVAPSLLRHTAGRSDLEVVDALDELVARQLLRLEEGAHCFNHELVRTAVYRGLTPWRRQILHRRAAEAIAGVTSEPSLKALATMAQHYDAAGANDEAVEAYRKAAQAASAVYAYDDAAGHLQRALSLLPHTAAEGARAAGLYRALGQNLAYVARHSEAREAYRRALDHCIRDDRLTTAQLHERIATSHLAQLHYQKARRRLERALAALEEATGERNEAWQRLWLEIKLSFIYLHFGLFEAQVCLALIQEITPVVERVGTTAQKSRIDHHRISVSMLRERYRPSEAIIALAERHYDRTRQTQGPRAAAMAAFDLGYCFLFADDLAAAEALLLESLARAEEVAYRQHEARCLAFLSTLYRQRGERAPAEAFARRALQAARDVGSRHYRAHALATLAWLDFDEGKMETAGALARQSAENFVDTGVPFAWLALIVLLAIQYREGQTEEASEAAAAMLHPHQRRLPHPLSGALAQAVADWKAGNVDQTNGSLRQAIAVALEIGYL